MNLLPKLENLLTSALEKGNSPEPELVSKAYDEATCSSTDRILLKLRAASFNPDYLAEQIRKLISPPTGEVSCLDVGCNIGAKTKLVLGILKLLGCSDVKFDGIDLSEKAINMANQSNDNPDVKYIVADFLNMELDANSYDYIFLTAVWHHIKDSREAMLRVEKLLKPGGLGIIFNGFYPDNVALRMISLLLQRLYRYIEKRNGLYYMKPLISEIRSLVEKECSQLVNTGDFSTGFPANIFNTRMVLFSKE